MAAARNPRSSNRPRHSRAAPKPVGHDLGVRAKNRAEEHIHERRHEIAETVSSTCPAFTAQMKTNQLIAIAMPLPAQKSAVR